MGTATGHAFEQTGAGPHSQLATASSIFGAQMTSWSNTPYSRTRDRLSADHFQLGLRGKNAGRWPARPAPHQGRGRHVAPVTSGWGMGLRCGPHTAGPAAARPIKRCCRPAAGTQAAQAAQAAQVAGATCFGVAAKRVLRSSGRACCAHPAQPCPLPTAIAANGA